jgi:WD40 repeat protein
VHCVKFDKAQDSLIYSGGWDDAVYLSDLREGGSAVLSMLGPHVCGESIDVIGNLVLAGSYRNQKNLLLFDIRNPKKPLQYLEMDIRPSASTTHFSECLLYSAQFNKTMYNSETSTKILAAAGAGGRNEIKFFESKAADKDEGGYKSTHYINEFPGGIYSMDFSQRSNKVAVGTAGGLVASFRLRVSEKMQ